MNLLKGWISTVLGILLMCASSAEWLGLIRLPTTHVAPKANELLVGFIIGAFLLFVPATTIEQKLEKLWDMLANKFTK